MEALFWLMFFLSALSDWKEKKVPGVYTSLLLFFFSFFGDTQGFLLCFSLLWLFSALLIYAIKKIPMHFIDLLYLSVSLVIAKEKVLFLVLFTVLSLVLWLKHRGRVPLLPPMFASLVLSQGLTFLISFLNASISFDVFRVLP